ncbi:MAG: cytochrome b N-terminal domain-containing protein [Gammaproteobacteria bacterium]|nr:cytochrome b N-terminal domain-containing protein [Gammaproteobacteria bacterium]MBP9729358.1 cytochrome b N-terminal domain-containing protein [Gammaproteobacteria bacterium]
MNIASKIFELRRWVDARFPLTQLWNEHLAHYYAPKNFNFWYYFGALALFILANQLISGLFLTMNYTPTAEGAFDSIEYIMREVPWGWLLRYLHAVGASFFFIVVYLHMFRALLYGSYKAPRELVWILGMFIFLCLMAEAFFGYLLPWGNMSFWGAQVITSLFGAIPYVGDALMEWIRGDYNVSGVTLNRFFALHVVAVPLVFIGLVVFHIMALHTVGSNNPDGIEIKKHSDAKGIPLDGIPFHPYYTVKDVMGLSFFLLIFCAVIFFIPDMGGYFLEAANFEPADPLKTPTHIAPVWYMTPYYAILRAIPHKLSGVIAMGASIIVWFFLPWLDRSPVKSIRYRGGLYKSALALFVCSFLGLGYLGSHAPTPVLVVWAQVLSVVYFSFFLLMPLYSSLDKVKPVGDRLSDL